MTTWKKQDLLRYPESLRLVPVEFIFGFDRVPWWTAPWNFPTFRSSAIHAT
ncbi:MAG: hypothetical protein MUF86_05845 [Akkermansiaceae bacterium]|jgi:hypothetical protein|nr:hypothetical protein [Akkermansiaceae bacterium]